MHQWSFATSPAPYGLGLSSEAFWSMGYCEIALLRKRFIDHQKFQIAMLANLRADVRNSAGSTKQDGSAWQAWDLGADEPKRNPVRRGVSKDQVRSYFISKFGPDGKGKKKKSALEGITGQPLPIRKVG